MVEIVVRSKSLSIIFVLGQRHANVSNFIKTFQKLQSIGKQNIQTGRQTEEQTNVDSDSMGVIKGESISSPPGSCMQLNNGFV